MNGSRLQWLFKFQSAWAKMDKSILMPESDVNLQAWLDPGMSRMQKCTLYVYVYMYIQKVHRIPTQQNHQFLQYVQVF